MAFPQKVRIVEVGPRDGLQDDHMPVLPCKTRIEFINRLSDAGLSQIEIGEKMDVLGPLGNGFDLENKYSRHLLVAGGIGVAPLLFTARKLFSQSKEVILFFGGATKNDLPIL